MRGVHNFRDSAALVFMEVCDPLKLIVNKTRSVKGVTGRRRFVLSEPLLAVANPF